MHWSGLGVRCMTQRAVDGVYVVNAVRESNQRSALLLVLMTCQAGPQLCFSAGKSGPRPEPQQFRQSPAPVGPGNMETSRAVAGFATFPAVGRCRIRTIAMRTGSDGLARHAGMTWQAGLCPSSSKMGTAFKPDTAAVGQRRATGPQNREQNNAGQEIPGGNQPARHGEQIDDHHSATSSGLRLSDLKPHPPRLAISNITWAAAVASCAA